MYAWKENCMKNKAAATGGIKDILVVRPFVAPSKTKFATIKGYGWPREGIFPSIHGC